MTANFFLVRPIEIAVLGMEEISEVRLAAEKEASETLELNSAQLGEFPEWEEEEGEN